MKELNEPVKTWYETNSQEIKLLQYILYHLKKSGHIIQTKNKKHQIVPDGLKSISVENGEFNILFE
jgi:hypothetical protein